MEVFNVELFAIEKAFKITWENKQLNINKVWIFLNSQATIKRLKNSSLKIKFFVRFPFFSHSPIFSDQIFSSKNIFH